MRLMITAAQALRHQLEAALQEMGAVITKAGYTDGSTSWTVLVVMPPRTHRRDVTQLLWSKLPGAAIAVEVLK